MRIVNTSAIALVFIAISLGETTAMAEAPTNDDAVSVQVSGGATRVFGDLAGTDVGSAIDIQVKTLFFRLRDSRLSAHLAFDLFLSSTTHTGDEFPFRTGSDLSITSFLFLPNLCWELIETTRVCGAIGQGTVNVNSDDDRRDYGTWNYELSIRQRVVRGLFVSGAVKYIGRVEQRVAGVDSQFAVTALNVGAGWAW